MFSVTPIVTGSIDTGAALFFKSNCLKIGMEICIVAQFHKVSYLLVLFFHYGFYEILH